MAIITQESDFGPLVSNVYKKGIDGLRVCIVIQPIPTANFSTQSLPREFF